jgi:hypothetical protein
LSDPHVFSFLIPAVENYLNLKLKDVIVLDPETQSFLLSDQVEGVSLHTFAEGVSLLDRLLWVISVHFPQINGLGMTVICSVISNSDFISGIG